MSNKDNLLSAVEQENKELRNIIELIAKSLDIDEPRYKWISIEIDDLKSKLQAAESKLNEMAQIEPVGVVIHYKDQVGAITGETTVSVILKKALPEGTKVYIHPPVAQSNADKVEIPKGWNIYKTKDDSVILEKFNGKGEKTWSRGWSKSSDLFMWLFLNDTFAPIKED